MNARRILPLLIAASLAGCASAPPYIAESYQPPGVAPQFLAAAVPMEPVAPAPVAYPSAGGQDLKQCLTVMASHCAWAGVTAKMLDECTAGPRNSVACLNIPRWMAMKDGLIGSTSSELDACANQIDAAGVKPPAIAIRHVEHFKAAADRYSKRFGS